METITFKQSKNWWQSKDLNWFIENADFAFTNSGYKGNRVRIVTKEKLNGMNCFEFDNDRYGIIIVSETVFSNGLGETIVDSTKDVTTMLIKFFNEWGAGEFVNPKLSLRSMLNAIENNNKTIIISKK